jgi:hypothetical protein
MLLLLLENISGIQGNKENTGSANLGIKLTVNLKTVLQRSASPVVTGSPL